MLRFQVPQFRRQLDDVLLLTSLHAHQPKDAQPVVLSSLFHIVNHIPYHVTLDASRVLNFAVVVLELDRLAETSSTSTALTFASHECAFLERCVEFLREFQLQGRSVHHLEFVLAQIPNAPPTVDYEVSTDLCISVAQGVLRRGVRDQWVAEDWDLTGHVGYKGAQVAVSSFLKL